MFFRSVMDPRVRQHNVIRTYSKIRTCHGSSWVTYPLSPLTLSLLLNTQREKYHFSLTNASMLHPNIGI